MFAATDVLLDAWLEGPRAFRELVAGTADDAGEAEAFGRLVAAEDRDAAGAALAGLRPLVAAETEPVAACVLAAAAAWFAQQADAGEDAIAPLVELVEGSLPESALPDLLAVAVGARMDLALCGHDRGVLLDLLRRLLLLLPEPIGLREVRIVQVAYTLGCEARLAEAADLLDLPEDPADVDAIPPVLIGPAFADAVEGLRLDRARALQSSLADADADDPMVDWYRAALDGLTALELDAAPSGDGFWGQVAALLARDWQRVHDLEGACRVEADEHPSSLLAFAPARAALALEDDRALRTAMVGRSDSDHWLDAFYRARLDLMEGREAEAAAGLEEACAGARACDALARLDFEWRCTGVSSPLAIYLLPRTGLPADAEARTDAAEAAVAPAGRPAARFVGVSPAAAAVRETVARVERAREARAEGEADVAAIDRFLVTGPPGSGRSLVAELLHFADAAVDRPLVVCPGAVLRGEAGLRALFGTVAPDGGETSGYLAQADGGTLIVEGADRADPANRAALAAALTARRCTPLGGTVACEFAALVVATAGADFPAADAEGDPSLYEALAGCRVELPPLAARREDLSPLVRHLVAQVRERPLLIAGAAAERLRAHAWPGGVRELAAVCHLLAVGVAGGAARADQVDQAIARRMVEP